MSMRHARRQLKFAVVVAFVLLGVIAVWQLTARHEPQPAVLSPGIPNSMANVAQAAVESPSVSSDRISESGSDEVQGYGESVDRAVKNASDRILHLFKTNYTRKEAAKKLTSGFQRNLLTLNKTQLLAKAEQCERNAVRWRDSEAGGLQSRTAAAYYRNAAELTPFEYYPEEYVKLLQRVLDNIEDAAFAEHQNDPEVGAFTAGAELLYCLRSGHSEGLTFQGSAIDYNRALEWFDKSEALLNQKEALPEEEMWFPPSLLMSRGESLWALGRVGDALESFDQLKEDYPNSDAFTFHLRNFLDQPSNRYYMSRYFE